jgi:hypothetical protein
VLYSDDLDESDRFQLSCWNSEQRIYAHMIANLLSAPESPESLVAWYATVGFASIVLPWRLRRQILEEMRDGQSVVVTEQSILEKLGTKKQDHGNGSNFLLQSESAIQSFLLRELHTNPSAISSVRERIKERTKSYLEQLRFPPSVIENVQNEIDQIDGPFLEKDKQRIEGNPCCNYFRDLDASDLSLFRPSKLVSTKKAYTAIRAWYQSHKAGLLRLGQRKDDYVERSTKLIDALPPANRVTVLEIRAVFREVMTGLREWAYRDSDEKYEMSEYAKLALQSEGLTFELSEDELKKLMSSWIWPYI